MKQEQELKLVEQLTKTNKNQISISEIGWTSRVYLIDNGKIVFKFPRNKDEQKNVKFEIDSLKLVKNHKFNVNIPIINWTDKNNRYIGFYGVNGVSIKETINSLNDKQRQEIGTQIGFFLKQLHKISNYVSPNIMTVQDEINEYQEKYQKVQNTLKDYFNEQELKDIDDLFMITMPKRMLELGEDLVFCHGDLGYNNILLENKTSVGIIDFGDAGLYDKSKDFIGLDDETLLNAALNSYGDNKNLKEKIAIRQKVLPILDLLFYIGKKDLDGIKLCISKIRL